MAAWPLGSEVRATPARGLWKQLYPSLSHGLVALTVTFRVLEGCGWPGPQGLAVCMGPLGQLRRQEHPQSRSPPLPPTRSLQGSAECGQGRAAPVTLFAF